MPGLGNEGIPAIQVEGVYRYYKDLPAVEDVSFRVWPSEIAGLIGSDGAGKTTILRMMATMLPPSKGRISILGMDIARHVKQVKTLLGYMPQRFALYPDLTVMENFSFFMDIYGIKEGLREDMINRYLGFTHLLPFLERRVRDLSGGMKQKLGLACVLVHEPKVLILDEPTNGVDPVSRREFWEMLIQMRAQGMTLLISTSYLDEAEFCDRIMVMHNSRLILEGRPSFICQGHPSLEDAIIEAIEGTHGRDRK